MHLSLLLFHHQPPSKTKTFFPTMASGDQKFPPQQQKTQPGKEHLMTPPPQFTSPDYKPSNKLQVTHN